MIDFSKPKPILMQEQILTAIARDVMRPISRRYDDAEETHDRPWEYINAVWQGMQMMGMGRMVMPEKNASKERDPKRPPIGSQMMMHMIERLAYGDVGMYLATPGGALAGQRWRRQGRRSRRNASWLVSTKGSRNGARWP
jgi:hypothetical protein